MLHRLALGLALFLLLAQPALADQPLDYATDNGHFYTQANGSPSGQSSDGFQITNDDGIPFFREYLWFGGWQVLGYPTSRRFEWDGFVCQATQRAVLQYDPRTGQVRLANIFDYLTAAGRDGWLRQEYLVPLPLDQSAESGESPSRIVEQRLSLLDANPSIRTVFSAAPKPLDLFGLPTSEVQDVGLAYAVRLQRGVIYRWKDRSGSNGEQVSVGNAGDMLKAAGLLPAAALVPEPPPPGRRGEASSRGGEREVGPIDGVATWYGASFHGSLMSNREPFDMYNPTTAASNTHPLGTLLRVTNSRNGSYVIVRVTDRGAFQYPIVVDLSWAAFNRLASPSNGVVPVHVEVVQ